MVDNLLISLYVQIIKSDSVKTIGFSLKSPNRYQRNRQLKKSTTPVHRTHRTGQLMSKYKTAHVD